VAGFSDCIRPNMRRLTSAMLALFLARLRAHPSRTGSLIITLFGDLIGPRGGKVWLGTMLEVFRGVEIADGVVRTALSRLAADGWLERTRKGRNSLYQLTGQGRVAAMAAELPIYGSARSEWGGGFHLAMLEPGTAREATRQALLTDGFGQPLPGLMVAPDTTPMPDHPGVLAMAARLDPKAARALAARSWPLDDLAGRYRGFLAAFPHDIEPMSDFQALLARLLLIHEWRRVVLRDPRLPAPLLPADWPGHAARALCARLYPLLVEPSERWLDARDVGVRADRPVRFLGPDRVTDFSCQS